MPGSADRGIVGSDRIATEPRPVEPTLASAGKGAPVTSGPTSAGLTSTDPRDHSAIRIAVLGPLQIAGPDGPVTLRGVKERTLLAMLTAHRDRTVPVSALVHALWQEQPPPSAHKSVQTFVLRIRKALRTGRTAPDVVITEGGGYRLTLSADAVDADRFCALVCAGGATGAHPREVADRLHAALDLWRGPAYVDFPDSDFARDEARRLGELRLTATEKLCAATLQLGQADAVVPDLERLLGEHPHRERLWALLIRALYRQGRQGDALRAFDRARRLLADDLGVEPGRELRELQAQVLAQDPVLDLDARGRLPVELIPTGPAAGRTAELAVLRRWWSQAIAGRPVLGIVRGPAASDRLRLAQELASEAVTRAPVIADLVGREHVADSPGPSGPGWPGPGLVVTDRGGGRGDLVPEPGQLILWLTEPDSEVPDGAAVLDLRPLSPDTARDVVATHVRPDDVVRATTDILTRTVAWPEDLHRAAARWAQQAAELAVREASATVTGAGRELAQARDRLSDGLLALTDPAVLDPVRPDTARVDRARPHPGAPDGVRSDAVLLGAAPTSGPVPVTADRCPWRGLAAYDVADAPWFAGRERLVAELLARVAGSRLVTLVGPSGRGKSSALRAGLIAELQRGALPGSTGWPVLLMRPGSHPMRELTKQALQAGISAASLGDVLEGLIRGDRSDEARRVVIAVDQLEELWTLGADEAERASFLDTIADLHQDPATGVTVLLTVRPDFLDRIAEHPRLARPLADNTVLIGSPSRAELARAVERPAATAGLRLEVGLVDAITEDAAGEPGQLPLLSTALARLWEQRAGAELTIAGYVAGGGLAAAVAGLAEDAYADLSPADRAAARVLLLRLAGPAGAAGVARRRVPLAELAGLPDPRVRALVEPLTTARLLTVDQDSVEVAHEALFDRWPRLRGWLAEDRLTQDVRRRLAVAAADWDEQERDPGLLWQGTRLGAGQEAAQSAPEAVTAIEREFLEAGAARLDAERREAVARAADSARQVRRLRWLIGGIVALLVAAITVGMVAIGAQRRAEAAAASAQARRLAAQAVSEQHLDLGLLSAVEAVRAEPGPETDGALLGLLTRAPRIVTQVHANGRFLRTSVSPDGSTVYLAENGPRWLSVDALTGALRWSASVESLFAAMAPDPQGHGVLTTRLAGTQQIVLIGAADGQPVWSTSAPADNELGRGAAWLADARWLVAGSGGVIVGNADTGRVEDRVPWPTGLTGFRPDHITVWPDGRAGLADADRTVVYDPATDMISPLPGVASVRGASSGGVLVAVDETDPQARSIRLHDLSGTPLSRPIRVNTPSGLGFSPDGAELAVGAGEVLQLRDGRTGDLLEERTGHSGAVMDIAYAGPGRDMLWTAGRDGTAIAWDRTGQRGLLRTTSSNARVWLGATSTDGRVAAGLAAIPDGFNTVSVLDPRSGRVGHPDLALPADCRWCDATSIGITGDGRIALAGVVRYPDPGGSAAAGADESVGYLAGWDTTSGDLVRWVRLPGPPVGLAAGPDDRSVVVGVARGTLLLDLDSGRTRWGPVPHPPSPDREATRTVALSPDGSRILVGIVDGAQTLDSRTGALLAQVTFAEPDLVTAVAFGADGRTVLLGTNGGHLHVLSATDLAPLVPRRLTTGGFLIGLAPSPDGRLLASLGTDGDLLLWDTAGWQPLGRPISDGHGWGSMTFDPDGTTLRTMHQDGTVVTFEADPQSWLRQACVVANRDLTAEESATIRPGQPLRSTCEGLR